jgi:superfamily I DNA and/or RNA helicase
MQIGAFSRIFSSQFSLAISITQSSQAREAEMAASRAILSSADIVIATCVGSGSPRLNSALGLDNPLVFSTILIDEATQASEPSCLVPLIQGCRQLILVGDQNQLPPTVMSVEAKRKGLGASLFARFLLAGAIPTVLTTQYRMHPVIAQFPSQRFYAGRLLSFPKPHERLAPKGFSWPNPAAPVAFVPVRTAIC